MTTRLSVTVGLVVAALVAGCRPFRHPSAPQAPLRGPASDSLLAADAARGAASAQLGLGAAAAAWFDPSVVYLRAGTPILYGRAAAAAAFAIAAPDNATRRWQPLGGGVARDGRTGYTYGIAAVATSAPEGGGSPAVRLDRYLAYWRRGSDGVWRVAAYSDVGGPAVPADAQPPASELPSIGRLPRGPRADAVRQVREADSAFALAADLQGTGVAFSTYVAPQGVVFAGGELVVGTDAVRAFYNEQQRQGATLNWRPVYADAADSGDLGMTVGEYVFVGRGPTGAAVQRFGKYLTIWKRQPDGSWRFVVDGGNPSPMPSR